MTELEENDSTSVLTKKQELNNHIVLMRKIVRQARVHVIRKLTRELKLLQKRKGPEKILNKAKRKADRLIEEISVVKKLSKDTVSVFALQNKKSLLDVLRNEKSSIEQRGIARLAHFSVVQSEVQTYRERNPHWELQIPVLLEKSKEKLKKIKKKQENESSQITKSHSGDAEEVKPKSSRKTIVKTEEVEDSSLQLEDKPEKKEKTKKPAKGKQRAVESSKVPIKIEKSEGTLRVQILTDLKDLENDVSTVNEDPDPEVTSEIVPKKRPKSAFFVGGEEDYGKEPKSSFSGQGSKLESFPRHQSSFRQERFPARNQERFKPQHHETKPFKNRYFEERPNINTARSASNTKFEKGNSGDFRTFKGGTADSKSDSGHLHPSWEAKKRQAAAITSFKGKKTTFGDD